MKQLLITTILLSNINLFGQTTKFEDMPQEILAQVDKMGIDNSPFLTELESGFFNILFQNYRKDFDFRGKKIAFITGNSGTQISNKNEYFKSVKKYSSSGSPQLRIFDSTQKTEGGGYDAVIVYWSKKTASAKDAVKLLKILK
jgi:hypothetical protein